MAKKLLHKYTFDASTKTVVLDGIYGQERLLMISNLTDNVIIYVFNQTQFGLTSYAIDTEAETTTLVLTYDTTSMSDTDALQIFVEMDSAAISPAETYVDPVSKIRVSNPENLIDTDFEYGLQSTKWETLELVKNIPTFYSRNGDESLNLSSVSKQNASEIISVTTSESHNLSIGNPIIVQGTDSISADGAFIVTAIPTATTFQYKAKSVQSGTGSILDTYTQIFIGSVYQGTEFQLSGLNSITTDGASPSTLTVTTEHPTNFSTGTSFFLSNSLGSKNISFNSANVEPSNTRTKQETVTAITDTGPYDGSMWAIGNPQPFNWTPKRGMFIITGGQADSTVNFNTATNEVEFDVTHVFNDGEAVMWINGLGNTNPGGISERNYWVRTTGDSKKIFLTTGGPASISRVNLTSQGANGGMMRSCFAYGIKASSVNTTSEVFTFDQNYTAYPANTPYLAMYTTLAGFNTVSNANLINYFETDTTSRSYYLNAIGGSNNTATFSDTVGGAVKNATSTTVNGIFVPMMPQADGDRNSFYLPKGEWVAGDIVWVDSTSIPGGITNQGNYELVASGATFPNRFRLQAIGRNPSNTNEANMTNYGGTGTTIHGFYKATPVLKTVATGETGGWAQGSVQPVNWLPEDALFFVGGTGGASNIGVNTGTGVETITFTFPHGLVDNKPYVYFCGYGNGVIGGLTDSRWYYVRVVDANTIYLTLTEGGTSRVNLSSAGSSASMVRSCFVKAYRATGTSDAGADSITFIDNLGVTAGQDQLLMACYTTFSNLTVFSNSTMLLSYEVGGGQVVYPKDVSPDGLTLTFSNQLNGSKRDLNSGAVNAGVMIKVQRAPDANSVWHPNHGYETGDVVLYYMTSTAIGGMTNGDYYKVTKVNNNRLSFQIHSNQNPVNFTNYGNGAATTYTFPVGQTIVATGDYIHATGHGLNDQDSVFYNSNGGTPILPLINGTTYYVSGATADKFQLTTTFDGVTGDAIEVQQNTSKYSSFYQINYTAHGFVTGDRVKYVSSSPVAPLKSGAFYYVYKVNNNAFNLHLNYDGCVLNEEYTRVTFSYPYSGTGTYQKTTAVDLETKGVGTQIFNATSIGATDGVYTIDNLTTDTSFELASTSQVPDRTVNFTSDFSVWVEQDAIKIPDHYFVTGQNVVYTHPSGTIMGGSFVSGNTYYVIRVSRDWIRLADSLVDANAGTYKTITSPGTGVQTFTTDSMTGEVIGGGTVSVDAGSTIVTGTNTNFTSFFNTGDTISFYAEGTREVKIVTSIATNTSILTTSPAHAMATGTMVVMDAAIAPAGTTNGRFYYIRSVSSTTFTLHNNAADAASNSNIVSITDAGDTVRPYVLADLGATYTNSVNAVTGTGSLQLTTAATATVTDANFTIGTSLLMRADGFAIHRPYDGGVELIPSKNPDSRMIRQTRRYFRYQSGKGIQVSFAVNFSPSSQTDTFTAVGTVGTIKTRYPHRLAVGLNIVMSGALEPVGTNYWNGTLPVASIIDEYRFTVTLPGTPGSAAAGPNGIPEFYVQSWSGSALRCGLFDDQNGLYFEYDGANMAVCRRNSTTQISGEGAVEFRSGTVTGVDTKFAKQLSLNDNIVIKGQTYTVTKITNDTNISILPTYRGSTNTGVVITKVISTKVIQSDWNIDKCDGTGPSGFYLDQARIQMAYIDYSWYGAGKVRFGFKDQYGKVIYVHEFIHNNKFREAYMRSGNVPARYEIENVGTPNYVPALAHWGTSVIMDGGFDADSAYQFTASSQDIQVTGEATVTVAANAEEQQDYYYFWNNSWRNFGRALEIKTPSFLYNSVPANVRISGASVDNNTYTRIPYSYFGLPNQPYQVNLRTRAGSSNASNTEEFRSLMLINRQPTGETETTSNYTVTVATTGVPVVYDIPLISIRLAPSVDTNTPGFLGEREIINRMQLILRSVGILSTHNCTITLRLNGLITNTNWARVENPSLSQLIYHTNQDQISGGIDIFNFRAQGGTGTTNRSAVVTTQELGEITTLGNSILGGNNVFPDGPDVLTIVAKLGEDPSTVSDTNPFNVTGRISWTESQA
jgi:hypothetical protein